MTGIHCRIIKQADINTIVYASLFLRYHYFHIIWQDSRGSSL